MKIKILETGNFMLDGGAIFGVVPKSLWSKQYPADENNLCNMSMRTLLIETGDRKILVDTGIGTKQDAKFFSYYYLNGSSSLDNSLKGAGINAMEISDVIHTHLHFDHCGGTVKNNPEGRLALSFPHARHFVSKPQWDWTLRPNGRERASFLNENILPLKESGTLEFLAEEGEFIPDVEIRIFNGHTAGLVIPMIKMGDKTFVFVADLLPFLAHIPLSWVCGYDTRPLITLEEKSLFLNEAANNNYILLFQHDLYHQACSLEQTEKGVRVKQKFSFSELGIQHIH
jgi:glyoxylase-like metal-dependent hydrolase (beta-lactamase superfamily II)